MSESVFTEKRFGDIAQVIPGYAFKSDDFGDEGFPVVKISEITPPRVDLTDCQRIPVDKVVGLERFKLAQNDILIAMTGATLGKVGRLKDDVIAYVNQRVAKIDSIEGISDKDFLYYLITDNANNSQIIELGLGSAQANFSGRDLENLQFVVPDLSIQQRIAAILTSLDDKIELNRQINATLEAIAQAIFREWFVEFRFPGATGEMEESELGMIPIGWRVRKLKEICDIKHGFAFKGEFFSEQECENVLLTPGNFKIGGGFNDDKFKYYMGEVPKDYVLRKNDLIVTMTDLSKEGDTLGYSALVPAMPGKNLLHNQRLGKVIFKEKLSAYYLYFLMRQIEYRQFVLGGATGSTVKHTSPTRICDYEYVMPDENILNQFDSILGPIIEKEQDVCAEIYTLASTRDRLVPKLMSGEIEV